MSKQRKEGEIWGGKSWYSLSQLRQSVESNTWLLILTRIQVAVYIHTHLAYIYMLFERKKILNIFYRYLRRVT